jgi:hypothetical protein
MDWGYVVAAFGATAAGTATGTAIDPITWILAGAVGATERVRPWRFLVALIFAAVRTGIAATMTTMWLEDPIIPVAPWFDLVGKFTGFAVTFLAIMFLAAAVAAFIRRRQPSYSDDTEPSQ